MMRPLRLASIFFGSNIAGSSRPWPPSTSSGPVSTWPQEVSLSTSRGCVGRGFTAEEGRPGGASVAVISNNLWNHQFGGDPSIIGRTILLNDENYAVVGVMPVGFESRPPADIWVPLRPVFNPQNDGGPLLIVPMPMAIITTAVKANPGVRESARML